MRVLSSFFPTQTKGVQPMHHNVFAGEDAIKAYLNPDNHPPLPLVELPAHLNPHREKGVRIFLKLMHFLPLANVKSLPAFNMLDRANLAGQLEGVQSLVEASSGNTVLSLAVLARAFGIERTLALVSHEVEPGKLNLLRLLGTDVKVVIEDICPDPTDPESAVNQAVRLGEEAGWFNAGQYHNEANPEAHMRWTGPQIWAQTEGKVTLLAAGLGTTGTLCGTGGFLKAQNALVQTVGVVRSENNPVPGVRTEGLLREIAFDWDGASDALVRVGTVDSYQTSLDLCRAGLLVGPSGGFALAGLFKHLSGLGDAELKPLRNADGEVLAVVISPDNPHPYLDEYPLYLGESAFPPIANADLLKKPIEAGETVTFDDLAVDVGIRPEDLLEHACSMSVDDLAAACARREEVTVQPPFVILDVRSAHEFQDHHLSGSDRVDYDTVAMHLGDSFVPAFRRSGLKPVFVCPFGAKSTALALEARKLGVEAMSLSGGTMEWSRLGLPRIKGIDCVS